MKKRINRLNPTTGGHTYNIILGGSTMKKLSKQAKRIIAGAVAFAMVLSLAISGQIFPLAVFADNCGGIDCGETDCLDCNPISGCGGCGDCADCGFADCTCGDCAECGFAGCICGECIECDPGSYCNDCKYLNEDCNCTTGTSGSTDICPDCDEPEADCICEYCLDCGELEDDCSCIPVLPFGGPVLAPTSGVVPASAPRNFKVEQIEAGEVRFSWDEPEDGAPADGYTLVSKNLDDTTSYTPLSYLTEKIYVRSCDAGRNYEFFVLAGEIRGTAIGDILAAERSGPLCSEIIEFTAVPWPQEGFAITNNPGELKVGAEPYRLEAEGGMPIYAKFPAEAIAYLTKVTFEGDNDAVAAVTDDGKVTALQAGKVTITATHEETDAVSNKYYLPATDTIELTIVADVVTVPTSVSNLEELKAAIALANELGEPATILLENDTRDYIIGPGETYELKSGVPITLTVGERPGVGAQYIRHFEVIAGTLIMGDGITLTRAEGYDGNGGGVRVATDGGKFIMNGGEISGNLASMGGGVAIAPRCTFEMNGGIIKNNIAAYPDGYANGGGGGVSIESSAEFYMNGGTITGNKAISLGVGPIAHNLRHKGRAYS
ncbi:MAG: Ig-like domain-containing protein [Oscillospiraceae bacterium]|nr:Ig-like domain-containing protein [Oscillospiraceae bacterium]